MLTRDDLEQIAIVVKKEITKETKPLKKGLTRIEKKLDQTIHFFDREITAVKKRVTKLENKVEITQAS